MKKLEAIRKFLDEHSELAHLFTEDMEVQVMAAPDGGERVEGEFMNKRWHGWTDGKVTWKSFRVPWRADTEPEYTDKRLMWSLAKHAEAIGLTGWDWRNKVTRYVGFDFDAVIGHQKGLSDAELEGIREAVSGVEWVTVRRSKSGRGIHLYVHFAQPVRTVNHTEHAALARAVLSYLSAVSGQDLESSVDTVGGVLWIWHRDTRPNGFQLLKEGKQLNAAPPNWKAHLEVVKGKAKRMRTPVPEGETDAFTDLISKHRRYNLDGEHKRLINWFDKSGKTWWWDSDHHAMVCHTAALQAAYKELRLRGIFYTNSTGKQGPGDYNCFMFPIRHGGWVVRRFGINCKEHPAWTRDATGWTRCFLNRPAELAAAAAAHDGTENAEGGFVFRSTLKAVSTLVDLGAPRMDLPDWARHREATLKHHKKDQTKVVFSFKRENTDDPLKGWLPNKKGDRWETVVKTEGEEVEVEAPDEFIRHVVTSLKDGGWYLRARSSWVWEPKGNLYNVLAAMNIKRGEADKMFGQAVLNHWELVNLPFQSEYPGNRRWNRDAAKLAYKPAEGACPTWHKVLHHCGAGLDDCMEDNHWCVENGLVHGGDYLKCWVAAMFQAPLEPLPYLFMYGPQNSGKSILHEALKELFAYGRGYVLADNALTSQGRFNGELAGAVLCVVEETDLRISKQAYERIKTWVTGVTVSIHKKGQDPYDQSNSSHWIQCANDASNCPVLPGDTRITMVYVDKPEHEIPKPTLLAQLRHEAPHFLHEVMNLELPPPVDRLRIPVLVTSEKIVAQEANRTPLELFVDEEVHYVPGHAVMLSEFYKRFCDFIGPEQVQFWTKRRMNQALDPRLPRGRWKGEGHIHIGNVSFNKDATPGVKLVKRGDRLVANGQA